MKWFIRFFLLLSFMVFSGKPYLEAHTFQPGAKPVLVNQAAKIFSRHILQAPLPSNIDYTFPYRLVQDLPEFVDESRDEEDEEPCSVKKCISGSSNYFNTLLYPVSDLSDRTDPHQRQYCFEQYPYPPAHRHILFQVFRV